MMEGGGFVHKTHVHYKCREGYEMQGSGTLTCGPNGKWIGETPVCKGAFHVTSTPGLGLKFSELNTMHPDVKDMPDSTVIYFA